MGAVCRRGLAVGLFKQSIQRCVMKAVLFWIIALGAIGFFGLCIAVESTWKWFFPVVDDNDNFSDWGV